MNPNHSMRVGELAGACGISVRTLHHYHEIGLLIPEVGGAGDHRLYGATQIARLQDVLSLRRLGFSLEEIGRCLDDVRTDPARILEAHLERLEEELQRRQQLRRDLILLKQRLEGCEHPSLSILLQAIRSMNEVDLFKKYYSPEQLRALEARKELVGEARMREVHGEWQAIFADYGKALAAGLDANSEEVLAIARRSRALIEEFTGGDAGIEDSLSRMYASEPGVRDRGGAAPELWGFMGAASAALARQEAGED